MKKDWRKFHKGDLIFTELGFPAFLYQSQMMKDIIDIYAFGLFDEHGSEYVDKAVKATSISNWLSACERYGYKKEYVLEKMKLFKIKNALEEA